MFFCPGFKTGAHTGRKDHCFHTTHGGRVVIWRTFRQFYYLAEGRGLIQFFSSCTICFNMILTLNLFLRCLARASAAYTLRCCPPVQPKLTCKFSNPLLIYSST